MTIQLPRRPDLTEILPVSSSADGKLNSYCMRCDKQEQVMSYPACQWRQSTLNNAGIKTPADWAGCAEAARSGLCVALAMRQEEDAAGQAIFFRPRASVAYPLAHPGTPEWDKAWASKTAAQVTAKAKRSAASVHVPSAPVHTAAHAAPTDALDAMGAMGGYLDAINAADASATPEPARAPVPLPEVPKTPPQAVPAALPGESPLAMARRIAAARAAAK